MHQKMKAHKTNGKNKKKWNGNSLKKTTSVTASAWCLVYMFLPALSGDDESEKKKNVKIPKYALEAQTPGDDALNPKKIWTTICV